MSLKQLSPHDIGHRELRKLARFATSHGWEIFLRRNGHLAWRGPSGSTVYTSATPSDRRAIGKIRSDLRRNGLDVTDAPR